MTANIQGYIIVHKETGERWGGCYDSIGGAKSSWRHAMNTYWVAHDVNMKQFYKKGFNDQAAYVIKPLVMLEE